MTVIYIYIYIYVVVQKPLVVEFSSRPEWGGVWNRPCSIGMEHACPISMDQSSACHTYGGRSGPCVEHHRLSSPSLNTQAPSGQPPRSIGLEQPPSRGMEQPRSIGMEQPRSIGIEQGPRR